ncbi:tripartite tricarboxylate transporter substrate binding protein [Sporomusa sp.]|uniref:tripartite tricarboxylate transporter substrate binding protein n=1 Tax=Sporomusa sp. TaxID=2078658 RepID=UPI002C71A32A|nr:tripartite tricarboxylate transporter substrate binding protein [Sporomusa sp.]HWR10047.1 tripartite tricarboxylate transporter substrate binding protein [Sporomusa sp.]
MNLRYSKVLIVLLGVALCAALLLGCSSGSKEAKYPAKSIEQVVPFAAGGPVDTSARILAGQVEKDLGQKVVIVNKAGGGATEGQSYVARAKPDGYTLLTYTSSLLSNTVSKKVDYTVDSFEPVAMYCFDPEVLVVYANSPYKTVNELVEASKQAEITVSTPGHSTSHHMAGVLMEQKAGAKFKYVHTKGAAESVPMVAGGHVMAGLTSWSEVKSLVEQGNLRVIGVMSETRDPRMPNVATFKESGIDIVYGAWRGIGVPKGTPPAVVTALEQAFKKAIESKTIQDSFRENGIPLTFKDAKGFAEYIKADFADQKAIIDQLQKAQK